MEAHVVVAHLAFQFGARVRAATEVNHQHIDGTGAHQGVADFQRLVPPASGWEMSRPSRSTQACGRTRIEACSASMKAQVPPSFELRRMT